MYGTEPVRVVGYEGIAFSKFRAFEFFMLKPTRPLIAYVTDILSVLLERAREFLLHVALLLLQHLLLLKTRGKFTLVGKDIECNTRVL